LTFAAEPRRFMMSPDSGRQPLIVLNLKKRRVFLALPVDFYLGCIAHSGIKGKIIMDINTRRGFFEKMAMIATIFAGGSNVSAQQPAASATSAQGATPAVPGTDAPRRNSHVQNGIYYFSGTGSNDGYPKDDHVLVTDPFEKHVTRTMDALKKSVERAGSNMDSLIHLDVFLCLPHADSIPMPTGKARFDAHKAQYDALNKIYGTYFSQGKAPSRACMAVEWIPGDSLIEIVGSALVVGPPVAPEK
jgi:enamine deaminase RidA (YjgF/YER057c/UK114 family)